MYRITRLKASEVCLGNMSRVGKHCGNLKCIISCDIPWVYKENIQKVEL